MKLLHKLRNPYNIPDDELKKLMRDAADKMEAMEKTARESIAMENTNKWLNNTHYHCKECGGVVKFLARIGSAPNYCGVRAMGICKDCNFIFMEHEKEKNEWIKL